MKKVCIILFLILLGITLIVALFIFSYKSLNTSENVILGDEIILPDRIVYKNSNNQYFEFPKDSEHYDDIIELVGGSLNNYSENGEIVSQDTIDSIHNNESFLEFDYETASKNYILSFGDTYKNSMVKLATTGGKVCSTNLRNINKLTKELDNISSSSRPYSLKYTELISKNPFSLEYKYKQQFKEINYKIYQVKITDLKTYERYEAMCNLSFEDPVTEDTFTDNDLILTVTMIPKISVKVSIGNIRYTYENLPNAYDSQYTAHLLVVSKIVNTDCIYNTDLSTVDTQANLDELETNYDEKINNLDENLYVKDFDQFYNDYKNSSSTITEEQAQNIATTAFNEALHIAGKYNESSQTYEIKSIHPNNFFTRKVHDSDNVASYEVTAYCFRRTDNIGNGVEIYIDNKLGKIIGGRAFGD